MRNFFVIFILAFALSSTSTVLSFVLKPSTPVKSKYASRSLCGNLDENWDITLKSPCKLNLFLRILGRRPSGYHDLASLFQAVSFSDQMYFSKLPDEAISDELICSDSSLAVDESNLVIKAMKLMREKTQIRQFFRIYLEKYVPMQAGLGGGSGNAATAMFAFNKLCNFPASLDQLRNWSGDIGSDITFFFTSGTAYCTGRGEIVESLSPLPHWKETAVHIFKPTVGLSTALVFKTMKLDAVSSINPEALLGSFTSLGALQAAAEGRLVNDLEFPAFQCEPILADIKADICAESSEISGAMMSGSGTSIYALTPSSSVVAFHTVLERHPTVRHYECNFLNKIDSVDVWY